MSKRHVVSIGGGITSTVELPIEVVRCYGADNVDFIIACVKDEHPDVWRMVHWLEKETGINVRRVAWQPDKHEQANGKMRHYLVDAPQESWLGIWDVFEKKRMMGSSMFDPCSLHLKRNTLRDYIKDHYPDGCVMHVGITYDERHRLKAITRNWMRHNVIVKALLVQKTRHMQQASKQIRAQDTLGFVPELYAVGFDHNNCSGFCVKAGKAHMARLLWFYPDLYKYHEDKEQDFRRTVGDYTIMKESQGGRVKPITLKELRERLQDKWHGAMFPPFDDFHEIYKSACNSCDALPIGDDYE